MSNKSILGTVGAVLAVLVMATVVVLSPRAGKAPVQGGYYGPGTGQNTPTVTYTTSSVGTASTVILASSSGAQAFLMTSYGTTPIFCAGSGTAPATNVGFLLNPQGSTTLTQLLVVDPNILGKGLNCLSAATGTVGIVKY